MTGCDVMHADSREALKTLEDASIDAVVTDPPYALVSIVKRFGGENAAPCKAGATGAYQRASAGCMGKAWDTGETAFDPAFWREVLRVLKPGAHVVAFGGTRTFHRLVCAIEDAGFEIRDQLAWLYASGFQKSHDVAKAIDKTAGKAGAYGAPKTAEHAEMLARGLARRGNKNAGWDLPWMDDPEAIDRYQRAYIPATEEAARWLGWGTALKPAHEPICLARKPLDGTVAANVTAHGTGALNIDGCRVPWTDEADAAAAAAAGFSESRARGAVKQSVAMGAESRGGANGYDPSALAGRWPANVVHDGSAEAIEAFPREAPLGSAARFFFSAKADARDRLSSKHPTVKPVDLMRWLVRMVAPPGALVLDPFAGTGTTGMAALAEGRRALLIEREAEYVADIRRRLAHVSGADTPLFGVASVDTPPAREGGFTDGSRTNDRTDWIETVSA